MLNYRFLSQKSPMKETTFCESHWPLSDSTSHVPLSPHPRPEVWGGFGEQDRLNYRFLLQKSPIKETIFWERDL